MDFNIFLFKFCLSATRETCLCARNSHQTLGIILRPCCVLPRCCEKLFWGFWLKTCILLVFSQPFILVSISCHITNIQLKDGASSTKIDYRIISERNLWHYLTNCIYIVQQDILGGCLWISTFSLYILPQCHQGDMLIRRTTHQTLGITLRPCCVLRRCCEKRFWFFGSKLAFCSSFFNLLFWLAFPVTELIYLVKRWCLQHQK